MPRALARLDQPRGLEAVHARHLHVEQDHGEVALEQAAQRGLARLRAHESLAERLENRLEREQVLRRGRRREGCRPVGATGAGAVIVRSRRGVAGAPGSDASVAARSPRSSARARRARTRSRRRGIVGLSAVVGTLNEREPAAIGDALQAARAVGVRAGEHDADRMLAVAVGGRLEASRRSRAGCSEPARRSRARSVRAR